MPQDAKTLGLDAGTIAEIRVAQAWFWDGYYVRRGIDLQHKFGADVTTVTDLDILGYSFDQSLKPHKRIGEVKTGRSNNTPRPLDRALWMAGLRQLVGAEDSEVTTAFPLTVTLRDACRRLDTVVQHLDDLEAREARLQIQVVGDFGSQGRTVALLRERAKRHSKSDPMLERAYWFLTSEVWFLDPFDALKRSLGMLREFSRRWPPAAHEEATVAARWFFAEAISITSLNLAIIANEAKSMNLGEFRDLAAARLAAGDIPFHSMRKLSDRVDEYVAKLLASVEAPADVRTSAMGAFAPSPPEYAEPLIELLRRLAERADVTAGLPRAMDALIFERLVHRREIATRLTQRLPMNRRTTKSIRLIGAFLRGLFELPEEVSRALMTPLPSDRIDEVGPAQPSLFDDAGDLE